VLLAHWSQAPGGGGAATTSEGARSEGTAPQLVEVAGKGLANESAMPQLNLLETKIVKSVL